MSILTKNQKNITAASSPPQNLRQILDLRISLTENCNLFCIYCRNKKQIEFNSYNQSSLLSFSEIVSFLKILARSFEIRKIHLTGGEPLLREGIEDFVKTLNHLGFYNIAMTTNAIGLKDRAVALKKSGLPRINISLDSLKSSVYSHISGGGNIEDVLSGIDAAIFAGFSPVKINTVVMRGINDNEIIALANFAIEKKVELRFIELMPIGYAVKMFDSSFISSNELIEELRKEFRLNLLPENNFSSVKRYIIRSNCEKTGIIGFISSCSVPFCKNCRRLRLRADGTLLPCLAKNKSVSVRDLINKKENEIIDIIKSLFCHKRSNNQFEQDSLMTAIGG